jgi:iron complex transport system permease protein
MRKFLARCSSIFLKRVRALPAWVTLPALALLLLVALLLGVSFGATSIPLGTILQVLLNGSGLFHFARLDPLASTIIWQERMPGVVGTALVGAALAVAGALFQAILRNPLADPFLIGTSSGAALGATITFVLPFAADAAYGAFFPLTSLFAFAGAIVTILLVYLLARTGGETPVVTLILAGVVINSVLVAAQTVLLTLAPPGSQFSGIDAVFNWLAGGVTVVGWSPVLLVGALIVPGILLALCLAGVLDAFGLGEESAAYLGLHVERYKLLIIALASLITAAAVSISGLIGFVGLVTPHAMRLLLGPRHRLLLPASALGGAIFLVLTNLLARTLLAPNILPDGVFTALVGAPFFLFLLRHSKRAYRW